MVITGLFDDEQTAEQAKTILSLSNPQLTFAITTLADQAWERVWMDEFKPVCFGDGFWICPSWTEPPEPHQPHLILDPGLAFGSGTHPTTALCLTWLAQNDITQQSVIDFGCGSGILALSALKLGAREVQAVDIDEQALTATRENARINHISEQMLRTGQPEMLNQPAEIILANILLAPLLTLKSRFHTLLKPNGQLVVSGLLIEQVDTLKAAYEDTFLLRSVEHSGDWALCVFQAMNH